MTEKYIALVKTIQLFKKMSKVTNNVRARQTFLDHVDIDRIKGCIDPGVIDDGNNCYLCNIYMHDDDCYSCPVYNCYDSKSLFAQLLKNKDWEKNCLEIVDRCTKRLKRCKR